MYDTAVHQVRDMAVPLSMQEITSEVSIASLATEFVFKHIIVHMEVPVLSAELDHQ